MARKYRLTLPRRLGNVLMKQLLRYGAAPSNTHLLSVVGRKTGRKYETPVNLVTRDGVQYLVSPYGERSWVRNARAAGRVTLSRGKSRELMRIEELDPETAAQVLKDYWRQNFITRGFFDTGADSSPEEWRKEAPRHPVFRLEPVADGAGSAGS